MRKWDLFLGVMTSRKGRMMIIPKLILDNSSLKRKGISDASSHETRCVIEDCCE